MNLSWKLLPLAALFALGVFLVSLPSGAKPASADAVYVTASAVSPGSVYTVTAQYTNNPLAGPGTLFASGFGTFTTATALANGGGTVAAPTGIGTTQLSLGGVQGGTAASTVTVTATFTCNGAGSVLFTLIHTTQVNSQGTPVNCGAGTGTGTGQASITTFSTVLAQGAQGSYNATATTAVANQYITITANPPSATFQQPSVNVGFIGNSGDQISGGGTTSVQILAFSAGTRNITGNFTCSQQGTIYLTISVSGQFGGVTTPAYSQPVTCGTGLGFGFTPVSVASAITVAASPTSVGCNGTAFVTVTVRNSAGGDVADGTSVSLTSSIGSLSPTSATTLGGGVLAVFTGPANQSGSATIQASASGVAQGNASITVNCAAASPTPIPAVAPPAIIQQLPAPILGSGTISPPNTGDAGLADENNWQLYAGIAVIAMSVAGAAVVVRARA